MADIVRELEQNGFVILPSVFSADDVHRLGEAIDRCLLEETDGNVSMRRGGRVYAARNILSICPSAREVWKAPPLMTLLSATLEARFGLVRGLFFDKPSNANWSLPWHRDRTIAVAEHCESPAGFAKPTRKAGVPHIEAPHELLEKMVTIRIHLDDADEQNGALRVIAKSHYIYEDNAAMSQGEERIIAAQAGDVLAMRPLLIHASGVSHDPARRRRVLHLEFAASEQLPGRLRWNEFYR